VPDKRTHRGPHPEDVESFAPPVWPTLRKAVADLSWLLSGGYADKSALKLVGDRYSLTQRQRMAVRRCACSDFAITRRRQHEVHRDDVADETLLLDGYNVLTTVEAGLAGGMIIAGRDGCYRDLASMHGTFRQVSETIPAVELVGRVLADLGVQRCVWYLDRPVSNSGRLKKALLEIAGQNRWDWQVELVNNPDAVLVAGDAIAATADSVILDQCARWFNLARWVTVSSVPDAWVVSLPGR